MIKSSFTTMVDIINKKTEYEELIHEGFSIPKKYSELDIKSAQWCLKKIHVFNSHHSKKDELINICKRYIELIEENNNVKFIVE